MKHFTTFFALIFWSLCAFAQVRLPHLVSNNLILQRDAPAVLWGWAAPGEPVSLTLRKNAYKTVADSGGNWHIQLPPQKAGGPHSITIRASNTITLDNILFGDVWLCSGQSNMETPISRVMTLFGDEVRAYANPNIRYVKIPLTYNFHAPQPDVAPCSWVEVTPETAPDFSAVAYFFAREMYEKTGVPVGIINSSVGGSPAEAWVSAEALQPFPAMLNDMRLCQSDEFVADMQRLGALPGRRWHEVLNGQDSGLRGQWAEPGYDDRAWKTTDLLSNSWGKNGFRPANGAYWFRREVEIPAGYEAQPATLYMGCIVNADEVFVNGKSIGTTGYQYPPRIYPIPAGALKAGKNLIAVRLISSGGFPEFVPDKPYKIAFADREVNLTGEWKYNTGALMPPAPGGGITFQYKPAGLYNAMIAPLKSHAVKGALWYQGESNTGRADEYYDLMSALIGDWRSVWGKDLPFFIIQLHNFMEPALLQQHSGWAALRDVQRRLAQTVPHTALAVTIDLGEWNDIHPLNKKDVGKRLALQALKTVYGKNIVSEGPVYKSCERQGRKIIISFEDNTNDLAPTDELKGFAVAGADGVFRLAKATIEGSRVAVWHDEVANPVAVRYAWANNPDGANLRNRSGLPASPFQEKLDAVGGIE
ncbi:MAG: beta galactosidase jelly roll domain-containing protein [Prevotellaceae bacterium]|jgi:sialate O-acetylesterase|nr:beta galactosidase jelly roll domain-containing protein [Prevotellaceae bacterium]